MNLGGRREESEGQSLAQRGGGEIWKKDWFLHWRRLGSSGALLQALHVPSPGMLLLLLFGLVLQTQQSRLGGVICPKPLTIEGGRETRPESSSSPSAPSAVPGSLSVGLSSLRLSAPWGQGCVLPC